MILVPENLKSLNNYDLNLSLMGYLGAVNGVSARVADEAKCLLAIHEPEALHRSATMK
jgi:hypothetical protein